VASVVTERGRHGDAEPAATPPRRAPRRSARGDAAGAADEAGASAGNGNGRAAAEGSTGAHAKTSSRAAAGNGGGAVGNGTGRAAAGTGGRAAADANGNGRPAAEGARRTGTRRTAARNGSARNGRAPDADNAPTAEMPAVPAEGEDTVVRAKSIPEAAVARLAVYLRVLSGMAEQGLTTVSSEELSAAAGVNSAKLRKDLSYLGSYGTRGVGYEVQVLVSQIERILGLTRQHKVAVVGIGNLGHALANYGGFPGRGFPVEALFDLDPDLIGVPVGGLPVSHLEDIPRVCAERQISIGIIATPPTAAQSVCDRLVAGGVQCILNFAPVVLQVPSYIEVRKVDLAVELQILSFHVARRADIAEAALENQGKPGLPGTGLPVDNGNGNGHKGAGTDGGRGMVVR
jgi:redox-sensing transcriptional repressor